MALAFQKIHEATAARDITKLTFEDVVITQSGTAELTDGYAGLDWLNMFAFNADDLFPGGKNDNPYQIGASGEQAIVNGYAEPATMSAESGTFDLVSARMTATFDEVLTAKIQGFRDGELIYSEKVKLVPTEQTLVRFDWDDVDSVTFISVRGDFEGSPQQMIIDNLKIADFQSAPSAHLGMEAHVQAMHLATLPLA